ncbi:MAG: CRISPR-associated protein Cas4 [Thermoleophilia bacterium]|nr:CRISPR-associated protein Cas4 [Thermoleophilia bacterium]
MITPSEVIEYIYCPRFIYFMRCLEIPQFEDRRYKVLKGREVHKRRTKENREYLRKKIGATGKSLNVYLASARLRVRGIVDEVLVLKDGSLAPLDYKYTPFREMAFRTHRIQLVLYALLIRETYNQPVNCGFLAYVRDSSKLIKVNIDSGAEHETINVVDRIFKIVETCSLPGRTKYRVRCHDCCYKNICV